MNRKQQLDRYREVRAIARQHQNAAVPLVARPTMMEYARRLGLAQANMLVCDGPADLNYVFDLALYARREGRSRAIDRYARAVHLAQGSDSAMVLKAMQGSRFALWRTDGRHQTAGIAILDLGLGATLWLMDEGMEATAPPGVVFAGRLVEIDGFVMTTGAVLPLDVETVTEMFQATPAFAAASRAAVVDDARFQVAVMRAALRTGATRQMVFQESADARQEMETA